MQKIFLSETRILVDFMQGPDNAVLRRLIVFFSKDGKHCRPREVKSFWESLTESEKNYYRRLVAIREI